MDDMACNELVAVLSDYLEGRLNDSDKARLEAHLEECPYCVTYLDQMRTTIAVTGKLTLDSIEPATRDELLAAFKGWRNEPDDSG